MSAIRSVAQRNIRVLKGILKVNMMKASQVASTTPRLVIKFSSYAVDGNDRHGK